MEPAENEDIAAALIVGLSLLRRRLRQRPLEGLPSLPELSALTRLDRGGPATASELAKAEQISPQSMGATVAALQAKGLIGRSADPADGRRVVLDLTTPGRQVLATKESARTRQIAAAMAGFTDEELAALRTSGPLLRRLAESL